MKRNEMQVGAEYAVLSPSARNKVDADYAPAVKRVRILDTEPVWVESYRSYRDDRKAVQLEGFGDDGIIEAKDGTRKVDPSDYRGDDAKRGVKVLAADIRYWRGELRYEVSVVPTSMVAMPWAEYAERRKAADERKEAAFKARERKAKAEEVARADRIVRRDKLNAILGGTNLRAKLADGEVVITGSPQDLLDLAQLAANA